MKNKNLILSVSSEIIYVGLIQELKLILYDNDQKLDKTMLAKKEKKLRSIAEIQKTIQPILSKYPIKRASLFGSYARQEARFESDLDILVEFNSTISLLQFVSIKLELEDALDLKVDLVEVGTVKQKLQENIFEEQIAIYG